MRCWAFGWAAALAVLVAADGLARDKESKEKKANTDVMKVTADEIAKDFKQDPAKALAKYKGEGKHGKLIEITVKVSSLSNRRLFMENDSGLKVAVDIEGLTPNVGATFTRAGRVKEYNPNAHMVVVDTRPES